MIGRMRPRAAYDHDDDDYDDDEYDRFGPYYIESSASTNERIYIQT